MCHRDQFSHPLSNVRVRDISFETTGCEIYQYADDICLLYLCISLRNPVQVRRMKSTRVENWIQVNKIKASFTKTRISGAPSSEPSSSHPKYCNFNLYLLFVALYLIRILNNVNAHSSYVARNFLTVPWLVFGSKHHLPLYVIKRVVNTLARDKLRSGIILFALCGTQYNPHNWYYS